MRKEFKIGTDTNAPRRALGAEGTEVDAGRTAQAQPHPEVVETTDPRAAGQPRATADPEKAGQDDDARGGADVERRALGDQRPERLRLVIADPDPLARGAVRDSLSEANGFVVVAEATNGVEAIELAMHYRPELMLMEVSLPRIDGIAACSEITERAPGVRVVMFSVAQPRQVEVDALRAGASGFLSKNSDIESTVRALRSVAGGDAAISRSLTMHLIELVRQMPAGGSGMRPVKSTLTSREWEVLDLICSGASTRRIAETLFLSEGTVYSHTKSILRKLGVHSRQEAAAAAATLRQTPLSGS